MCGNIARLITEGLSILTRWAVIPKVCNSNLLLHRNSLSRKDQERWQSVKIVGRRRPLVVIVPGPKRPPLALFDRIFKK